MMLIISFSTSNSFSLYPATCSLCSCNSYTVYVVVIYINSSLIMLLNITVMQCVQNILQVCLHCVCIAKYTVAIRTNVSSGPYPGGFKNPLLYFFTVNDHFCIIAFFHGFFTIIIMCNFQDILSV